MCSFEEVKERDEVARGEAIRKKALQNKMKAWDHPLFSSLSSSFLITDVHWARAPTLPPLASRPDEAVVRMGVLLGDNLSLFSVLSQSPSGGCYWQHHSCEKDNLSPLHTPNPIIVLHPLCNPLPSSAGENRL